MHQGFDQLLMIQAKMFRQKRLLGLKNWLHIGKSRQVRKGMAMILKRFKNKDW
jgi:hypothetical protein